jgi:hypothetical protein
VYNSFPRTADRPITFVGRASALGESGSPQAGLVQAKWSDQILDEVFKNISENRPDLDTEALARTRRLMVTAIRDCLVTGYEPLVVLDQIGLSAKVVWGCVQQIANSWRKPPGTVGDVLTSLERWGLVQSVAELRAL